MRIKMISAKFASELTNAKNGDGIGEIIKRLERKIIKQANSGYNELYVNMSDLGKTEGRIANVIGELNKQGYVVFNDGYGKIIKWGVNMTRVLNFYESDELRDCLYSCTTYKDFKNAVGKLDVLHTNETSALSFEYLYFYDVIVIHKHNRETVEFYRPSDGRIVENNSCCSKELRLEHDLRKMYLSGMFD